MRYARRWRAIPELIGANASTQRRAYRHMPPKKSAPTSKKAAKQKTATAPAPQPARRAVPTIIHPMLATLVDDPFSDPDWIFETKWDGFRSVCLCATARRSFFS
jgi:ATP-dependent DNA ligase